DGMRRNELDHLAAEALPCRRDHIALGAAAVGDDRRGLEAGFYLPEYFFEVRDRSRDEDQIRAPGGGGRALRDRVNGPKIQRAPEVGAAAACADDVPRQARALEREREGAADEPDADDGDPRKPHQPGFTLSGPPR